MTDKRERVLRAAIFTALAFTALSGFTTTWAGDAPETTSPKDAKILNRIIANWNARSERARSAHLKFDYSSTILKAPGGIRRSQTSNQCEVWLDGNERVSAISYASLNGATGQSMLKFRRWTDDGKVQSVRFFNDPNRRIDGFVAAGRLMSMRAQRFLGQEMEAVWLAFRAVHSPLSCRPDQFRLVTENAIVDGTHYTKIERTIKEPAYERLESFWVDPLRDDVIVHWEMQPAPAWRQYQWRGSITYQKDASQGWIPSRWKTESTGPYDVLIECVVVKSTFNEKFPPSTFVPEFPPGSVVDDQLAGKRYRIESNGTNRTLPPIEFQPLQTPRTDIKK